MQNKKEAGEKGEDGNGGTADSRLDYPDSTNLHHAAVFPILRATRRGVISLLRPGRNSPANRAPGSPRSLPLPPLLLLLLSIFFPLLPEIN